ncbi:LamG domain-containing protein [Singulisphaera rosea]
MITRTLFLSFWLGSISQLAAAEPRKVTLESTDGLDLHNTKAEVVDHRGRKCVRLTSPGPESTPPQSRAVPAAGVGKADGGRQGDRKSSPRNIAGGPGRDVETLAILTGLEFDNGTIEIELAGEPASTSGAAGGARGFVGLAFHVDTANPSTYDAFYIRPTNGRAEDQVRRNHSTQYISHPDYPWALLRDKFPSMYESYADLVPSEWTRLKIVVTGRRARLYVNGADQPCLIVNDLKRANTKGGIALWTEPTTISHFRNLVVTPDSKAP